MGQKASLRFALLLRRVVATPCRGRGGQTAAARVSALASAWARPGPAAWRVPRRRRPTARARCSRVRLAGPLTARTTILPPVQAPAPCITHRAIKPISARTRAELAISPFDGLARCWRHDQRALDIFEGDQPAFRRQQGPARGVERSSAHLSERPPTRDLEALRVLLDRAPAPLQRLLHGRPGGVEKRHNRKSLHSAVVRQLSFVRSGAPRGGRDRTCWDLLFP
jgi:hypothetical protein